MSNVSLNRDRLFVRHYDARSRHFRSFPIGDKQPVQRISNYIYNVYIVYTNGICKKLKSYSSAKKEPSRALRTIACGKVYKLELPLPKKVKFSDQ